MNTALATVHNVHTAHTKYICSAEIQTNNLSFRIYPFMYLLLLPFPLSKPLCFLNIDFDTNPQHLHATHFSKTSLLPILSIS